MGVARRVLAVLGVLAFLVGGALYVGRMSAAQEALEKPPVSTTEALARMTPIERTFVRQASEAMPLLGLDPAETLRLGYQACNVRGLGDTEMRDRVRELFERPGYDVTAAEATIIWYRAKGSICARPVR